MSHKLYLGDCLTYLDELADNLVDLAIIDPPYDLDIKVADRGDTIQGLEKYNDHVIGISNGFDINVLQKFKRIMRKFNSFIFCSNDQLLELMQFAKDNGYIYTLLAWHKYNSVPFANNVWRQDAEWVLHIREQGATFQGDAKIKRKITRLPIEISKYGHPTEKPLELIKNYIMIGSNEGDTVLDCFMGSGTTGHAAIQLKRKFIGMELRPDYFEVAKRRIEGVAGKVSDLPLFSILGA